MTISGRSWFLALAVGTMSSSLDAQSIHKDAEAGYRIKLPEEYATGDGNGWYGSLPRHNMYLIDHFARKLPQATKYSWIDYDMFMATYFFPAAQAETKEAPADGSTGEKVEAKLKDKLETIAKGDRNYRGFRTFAEDNIQGFFFSKEKKGKFAGMPGTLYELKFEKLTEVPQLWVACAYELPDGEFAVLFNCTEQHHKKYLPAFMESIHSFTVLSENGIKLPQRESVKVVVKEPLSPESPAGEDLSPEERRKRELAEREARFRAEVAKLDKGWRNHETEHFLVLSHEDAAYTRQVAQHAEKLRAWMDEVFGSVGTREVGRAIIRIFADADEAGEPDFVFIIGTGGWIDDDIGFFKPKMRFGETEFQRLNHRILDFWFREKSSALWNRLPRWFSFGLQELVSDAVLEGGKLVFRPNQWERVDLARALALQEQYEQKRETGPPPLLDVQEIFRLSSEEQWKGTSGWYREAQTSSVLRYLLEGPGRKGEKTQDLLKTYLGQMLVRVEEVEKRIEGERDASRKAEAGKEKLSEDEQLKQEDAEHKKRLEQSFEAVEKDIQTATYDNMFGAWTEEDWKSFDRKWRQWAPFSIKSP